MAEEIKQVFIVDGSQAIGEINRLNKAFATLDTNLKKNSGAMGRLDKSARQGAVGIQKISISFQTLARIVSTQVIIRAMSRISIALKSSVQDAIAFEKQVAEISTISTVKDLGQLKDTVRGLSDAFNLSLGDVGKGLYQVISNQIEDAGGNLDVLNASLKFSKVAVTDAADSINLLSGVLNAYGKSNDQAERTAATLFKTIELGRTTGPELANSLGRVIPVASQLGIRLEEVGAAIADITLTGVKTNEAVTQLRGLMTSLLKPTTAMKDAMKELGFQTGEQIISTLGLQGAFKALVGTTDGSSAALAKLVPRVRGLNALIRIGADENSKFAESLKGIDSNSISRLRKEFERVVETDAEQLTNELNKIKNIFTTEFGAAIVEVGNDLVQATKGAGGLTDAVKTLATALKFMGDGAIIAASGLQEVSKIGALLISLFQEGGIDIRKLNGQAAAFESSIAEAVRISQDAISDRIEQEQKLTEELDRENKRRLGLLVAAENKRLNIARGIDTDIIQSRKDATDKIIRGSESAASKQLSIAQKLQQDIIDSESRSKDIQFDLNNKLFQSSLQLLSPKRKLTKLQSEQNKVQSATNRLIKKDTRTGAENQSIKNNLRLLDSIDNQVRGLISQNATKRKIAKADKESVQNAKLKLDFEASGREQAEKSRKVAIESSAIEKERTSQLKKLQKVILENSSAFDESGKLLSKSDQAKRQQVLAKALPAFQELAKGTDLTKAEIDSLKLSGNAIKQLQAAVKSAIESTSIDFGEISLRFGVKITNAEELQSLDNSLSEAQKKLTPIATAINKFKDGFKAAAKAVRVELIPELKSVADDPALKPKKTIGDAVNTLINPQAIVDRPDRVQRTADLAKVAELQKKLDAAINAETPAEAAKAFNTLNTEINTLLGAKPSDLLGQSLKILSDAIKPLIPQIQELSTETSKLGRGAIGTPEQLQDVKDIRKEIKEFSREVPKSILDTTKSTEQALTSTASATTQIASNATALAAAATAAANAAKVAATAFSRVNNLGNPITAANGRQINRKFFAHGGRGADQISAMLSPGERVTNARSSHNFASQLEAINAGHKPVFRDNGGTVNNITVGDINVQGGETSQQTARAIMVDFRRELRRNASTLT